MKFGKFLVLFGFVLTFAISFVSASYSYVNYPSSSYSPYSYYSTQQFRDYWPIVDSEQCKGQQDLLLYVPPGGCQPAVVKSDLLAEQNVPVFCQINAIKLNPLVDIKQIRTISFDGKYPSGVSGAGFHPAKAALRTYDMLLGDAAINNIGYVVLILKKQANESSLPELVNVTLRGRVQYESGNALGIGRVDFYLSPQNEDEWQETGWERQSFWNGRYSIRAERIEEDSIVVSIYHGDQKITTTSVQKGKPSNEIYVPGSYCRVGLIVNYNGLESDKVKARLEISDEDGTDVFDVYPGSRVLDSCKVNQVVSDETGTTGYVELSCGTLSQKTRLAINPRTTESDPNRIIPGEKTLSIAPLKLNTGVSGKITEAINTIVRNNPEACELEFTALDIQSGVQREVLTNPSGLKAGYYSIRRDDKNKPWEIWFRNTLDNRGDSLEDGTLHMDELTLKYELIDKCNNEGIVEVVQDYLPAEENLNESLNYYHQIIEDYSNEKVGNNPLNENYGEIAFEEAIKLAGEAKKYRTQSILIEEYLAKYPNSKNYYSYSKKLSDLVSYDYGQAAQSIVVKGDYKTARLVGFSLPDLKETSTNVLFDGRNLKMRVGDIQEFSTSEGKSQFRVTKIADTEKITIEYKCAKRELKNFLLSTKTLKIGESNDVCGKQILLQDVSVSKVAKVSLTPVVGRTETYTNLTVGIGIEKRAIKLSPEKTLEIIENLNESIKKWESISNNLAKVVKGLKGACFATAGVLTVKNFISGIDGTALAREHAMSGDNGWKERCKDAISTHVIERPDGTKSNVQYQSLTECFNKEASYINADVENRKQILTKVNENIEKIESDLDSGTLASGRSVNTVEATKTYLSDLKSQCNNNQLDAETCKIILGLEAPDEKGNAYYGYADLRELHYQGLLKQKGYSSATGEINKLGTTIEENKLLLNSNKQFASTMLNTYQMSPANAGKLKDAASIQGTIGIFEAEEGRLNGKDVVIPAGLSVPEKASGAMIVKASRELGLGHSESKEFLVVGNRAGNELQPVAVYETVGENDGQLKIQGIYGGGDYSNSVRDFKANYNVGDLENSERVYINSIRDEDWKVRYFETGPDKGFASLIPFDKVQGWYVRIDSNFRVGSSVAAYDSSGLPKFWYICNVGVNTKIDSNSDECNSVREGGFSSSSQLFGLSIQISQRLFKTSRQAILDANRQKGTKMLTINGQKVEQGVPVSIYDGVECQDFMSPGDCKLLFNVCDPVICPATRCDLGGDWPVSDVIQTGIIGSTVLCLPNFKEGVYIPVCLTGIQAGIDSYVSILKSYRECLQENIKEGKLVGICDQITSVYLCEFFWRQIVPVAKFILPKIVESAYGQGAHGGGEYLSVMSAWNNMQNSVDYFTQTYAVNSLEAYKLRSIEEAGTQFCKAYVSASIPTDFDSLLEPESPPQFHAWFSSTKFNDATVPATSQYKVFYHIYAGKNSGTYYSVYLKSSTTNSYYSIPQSILVDSGFITRGEYKTETKDFTAPEGYSELCVEVNGKEECGFGQVSTSFAVDYLKNKYVAEQAKQEDITTEAGCISGTRSLSALTVNTNPQSAFEETVTPQIYERGIVRICATNNPGGSTNPSRYVDSGYCGDTKLRCWLDKESVSDALTDNDYLIKNQTLKNLEERQKQLLESSDKVLTETDAMSLIKSHNEKSQKIIRDYSDSKDYSNALTKVNAEIDSINTDFGNEMERLYLNHYKAAILLMKAQLKAVYVRAYFNSKTTSTFGIEKDESEPEPEGNAVIESGITLSNEYSPNERIFISNNGVLTNIYFFGKKVFVDEGDSGKTVGVINDEGKITLLSNYESIISESYKNNLETLKLLNGKIINGKRLSDSDSTVGQEKD